MIVGAANAAGKHTVQYDQDAEQERVNLSVERWRHVAARARGGACPRAAASRAYVAWKIDAKHEAQV